MDAVTLNNGIISATIKANGAELCSLRDPQGREVLWQAGPEWPRQAPILFPIIGCLKDDVLRHDGKTYRMTKHGFARDLRFAWAEQSLESCALTLSDSAATRAQYPFAFQLRVNFALEGSTLVTDFTVSNTGDVMLPASVGAHPALQWPLPGAAENAVHRITFSDPEPAPVCRLQDGLILAQREPTPVRGRELELAKSLFDTDALIFDQITSTSLRYDAAGASPIDVSWRGFRELGIWSAQVGARFVCIEPWAGFASPVDFDGEFSDKPGVMHIGVGESRSFTQRISLS